MIFFLHKMKMPLWAIAALVRKSVWAVYRRLIISQALKNQRMKRQWLFDCSVVKQWISVSMRPDGKRIALVFPSGDVLWPNGFDQSFYVLQRAWDIAGARYYRAEPMFFYENRLMTLETRMRFGTFLTKLD